MFFDLNGQLLGVFSARKVDKWPPKSKFLVNFWPSEMVIFTDFRAKKPVFLTFCKLFGRCSGSVWALFLDLQGQLVGIFSAPKVAK